MGSQTVRSTLALVAAALLLLCLGAQDAEGPAVAADSPAMTLDVPVGAKKAEMHLGVASVNGRVWVTLWMFNGSKEVAYVPRQPKLVVIKRSRGPASGMEQRFESSPEPVLLLPQEGFLGRVDLGKDTLKPGKHRVSVEVPLEDLSSPLSEFEIEVGKEGVIATKGFFPASTR